MRPSSNIDLSVTMLSPQLRPGGVARCRSAIIRADGHVAKAAKALKLSTRTLYRYIEKYPEIIRGLGSLTHLTIKPGQKRTRSTNVVGAKKAAS